MILRPQVARTAKICISGIRFRSTIKAPKDEQIRARFVRLVHPETGSLVDEVQRTQTLLRTMDRERYWLVQVTDGEIDKEEKKKEAAAAAAAAASSSRGKGKSSSSSPWMQPPSLDSTSQQHRLREQVESNMESRALAIVKMVDKKEEYHRQKAIRKERQALGEQGTSVHRLSKKGLALAANMDLYLTWSSTSHDLDHKLKIMLTHFKKRGPGAKGSVTIRAKANKGKDGGMENEDKKELIQKIQDRLCIWETGEKEEETIPDYHARRTGAVDWKGGMSQATIRFDVVKGAYKQEKTK